MVEKITEFLNSLGYAELDNWKDNGQGYRFVRKEPSGEEVSISIFMGNRGRQTISKRNLADYSYNNYIEFTPTELKFFDLLDFEISYWHNYHTDQIVQDWIDAAEIELNY